MVMGGVPFARVRGFESQHRILDGHPSLPLLTKEFNEFDYYGRIFYDIGLGFNLTRLDYPVFLNEPGRCLKIMKLTKMFISFYSNANFT